MCTYAASFAQKQSRISAVFDTEPTSHFPTHLCKDRKKGIFYSILMRKGLN